MMFTDERALPVEIWIKILSRLEMKEVSKCCLVARELKNIIYNNKWDIIDNIKFDPSLVPLNKETYLNYDLLIDMTTVLYSQIHIPEESIVNLDNDINFTLLCSYQRLSSELIRRYHERIPYQILLAHQYVPLDILNKIVEKYLATLDTVTWGYIWSNQPIGVSFTEKYKHYVNWHLVSRNKHAMTYEFLEKYKDCIIWREMTQLGLPCARGVRPRMRVGCSCSVNSVLRCVIILPCKSSDNVVLLFCTNSLKSITLGTII